MGEFTTYLLYDWEEYLLVITTEAYRAFSLYFARWLLVVTGICATFDFLYMYLGIGLVQPKYQGTTVSEPLHSSYPVKLTSLHVSRT